MMSFIMILLSSSIVLFGSSLVIEYLTITVDKKGPLWSKISLNIVVSFSGITLFIFASKNAETGLEKKYVKILKLIFE